MLELLIKHFCTIHMEQNPVVLILFSSSTHLFRVELVSNNSVHCSGSGTNLHVAAREAGRAWVKKMHKGEDLTELIKHLA